VRGGKAARQTRNRSAIDRQLPLVIDTLITVIRNGELDQQLAQASKRANLRKTISGQRDGKFEE
jgi:hypothetical protein